jgi:tetratricopeptide (TPR) repeat protein
VSVGDDALGLLTAAEYYLRLGRLDDAFDLATRANVPRFTEPAHRILGLVYRQRGDHVQAVSHLSEANQDADVREALIRCYLALGQLKAALERAEQADKLGIATAGLREAVSLTKRLEQRRRDVIASTKIPAGKQDVYNEAAGRFGCAEYAWREGRPATEIETLLGPVLADGLGLGPAYGLRGLLALEHGRLTRALTDADRAIVLNPQEMLAFLVRGRVRLERGTDGAVADLTKAVELSGRHDAMALHWLAAAQLRAGKRAEALAAQREAVRLRPGDRELTEQLKELEATGKGGAGE